MTSPRTPRHHHAQTHTRGQRPPRTSAAGCARPPQSRGPPQTHHNQQLRAQALDGSGDTDSSASEASTSSSSSSSSSNSSSGRRRRVQLPPPCDLGGAEPQSRWNAVSLAYLGDAVWEAHLRSQLYSHGGGAAQPAPSSQQLYNSRVAAKANTHAQSSCYELLLAEGWPSAEEAALMRWAANSSSVAPPKHATRQQYKQATALEALVAYLYLKDTPRLQQLMDWLLEPGRAAQWRSQQAAVGAGAAAGCAGGAGVRGQRRRH